MQQEKGYTIIEMLVVVAIVAILPTIIMANFPQIKLQFALSRAAYEFVQNTRHVQDLSLSSSQYIDEEGNAQQIAGYGVALDLSSFGNKSYVIYADAYPGNQQYDALDYVISTVVITGNEPGVIIKEIDNVFGNSASINFNPPNPTTAITQLDQNESTINVVFALESNPSITKTVSVNTSGLVEIK